MPEPTLVITGANGFVGTHLARIATQSGYRVLAVGREARPSLGLDGAYVEYVSADLARRWPITESVDAIVHLAGLAAVGPSFDDPQKYISVNSSIMTNMGEYLLEQRSDARVVVVSSGSVYGAPQPGESLHEESPVSPTSPYAVAKLLVEHQSQYYAARGLDTLVVRPFNHIGPGQSRGFLVPDLAADLDSLARDAPLSVGNLATARDYTDVRDVSRAYLTLAFASSHTHNLYNVASGTSHSGREILDAIARSKNQPLPALLADPARLRPTDPLAITGSAERIRHEFGWTPSIDWRESIREFVTTEPS